MVKFPVISKRFKTAVVITLSAIFVLAAVFHLPRGISSWTHKYAPKLKAPFFAVGQTNDPLVWGKAPADSLVFYALGDTGTGQEGQYAVGKAMDRSAQEDQPSCVMLLGDNFYPSGVTSADDPQWESAFEKPYAGENLQIPFFACLGNHDHDGDVHLQLEKNVKSERWNMPEFNYTFFPDPARPEFLEIFIIDTDPHTHDKKVFRESVETLNRNLKKSKARWKIVAGHHPIQSGGRPSYHGKRLKDELFDTLIANDVDLYLCGHNHHMEMGTVDELIAYAVVGSGSSAKPRIVKIPNMHFAAARLGFAKIKVSQDQVIVAFTTDKGEAIYTETITK